MGSGWKTGTWTLALLEGCLLLGCAHLSLQRHAEPPLALDQLRPAVPADPFAVRVANWQVRAEEEEELAPDPGPAQAGEAGPAEAGEAEDAASQRLREAAAAFLREQQLENVRSVARWIQDQAQDYFLSDQGVDHWATLGQVFERNGDDCDGLAVLVLHQLRALGIADDSLYLAVTQRERDGTHHMVVLWFAEQGDDPFVIDPTGAMTPELARLSALPDWTALALFSEREHWAVDDVPGAVAGTSPELPAVAGAPPS